MPTANPQPMPNPAWQNPSWQNAPWGNPSGQPHFWSPGGYGRPIAIAAIVFLLAAGHIGRMLFWPVALAGVVFMVATGRFGCGRRRRRWANDQGAGPQGPSGWQSCIPPWANWGGGSGNGNGGDRQPSSGNHAFDEYRAETLRRLEEEQNEFSSFLERLRFAKDKAEFDQFMAERRQQPRPPIVPDEPSAHA